jgi:hypothetical protein
MAINNAKHIIGEIDGVRCTIIETGASSERTAFLTDLLSYNNLEVKILQEQLKDPAEEPTFTIGVADVVFNHVFAIYERALKTPDGEFVTPAYWRQECTDCDPRYWLRKKGRKA